MDEELFCGACNMVFRSMGLLRKHKALFCIGSEGRRFPKNSFENLIRDNAGDVQPEQLRLPDPAQLEGQQRKSRWRSADAETQTGRSEQTTALQNLTDEFQHLRMSVEEILPHWSERSCDTEACGRRRGHTGRLTETREIAALHEHQLALIRAHNQQLEQQRDELTLQVNVLAEQSGTTHLESLLMELQEQEERNEETLQQLAEHVHMLQFQSTKEIPVPAHQPAPRQNKMRHDDNGWELISSVDGPLSVQIKALRQAYLQSGGSDPAIVAQMIDLQAEAQSLEKNRPASASAARKKEKVQPPQQAPSWKLLAVEQENQRLEEEILMIQLARKKHHNYEAAAVRAELHELTQTENLRQQIVSLQAKKQRSKAAPRPLRQPPPPPIPLQPETHMHAPFSLKSVWLPQLQARSFSSPLAGCMVDPLACLGPAPYDPEAGFVVFYDLVLGVDASQKALRLVAALYSEGQEAGPPTPLPPVQCLPGLNSPYTHSPQPGLYALLYVKQPVPRIQPSPSLSLVVEVQTATDLDVYNQEVFNLLPCGWTRLDLFDQHNQLCSGHWRAPVRRLPIRPSLSLAQLNSIPQVNNMELLVRLVNGRDEGVQTAAKPHPSSTSHYKYPAVMSPLPVTIPASALQPFGVDGLSSLLPFTDSHQVPPPPTEEASQS